jgi:selenocysteine lyase/cysteine desulfurase
MPSRRDFIAAMSVPAAIAATGLPLAAARPRRRWIDIAAELARHPGNPAEVADDEDFWAEIARAFEVDRSIVNFNNGGVSPAPAYVQDALKRHIEFSNEAPAYTMWQVLEPQREAVRARMARQWGVDAEEVAITRNASESLQTLQLGIDLEPGDELLTSTQDYGRMITTFQQRERREGVVLKQIQLPIPAEDPAEVVRRFEAGITPRTRAILMCHMINITGQILPVRDVVEMATGYGIPVIVDGAHALAHFDFSIPELGCENYSSSLHKWLFAPIGAGFLWVKRERIPEIWPLMAAPEAKDDDIRKFEEIGTHPEANFLAVAEALTFHQGIGPARKEERLVYLRNRWAERLLEHDRVRLHTSLKRGFACGIATVQVEGIATGELNSWLWNRHRIFTVAIHHAEFEGLRISPSVYSTLEEVDRFSEAMEHALRHGITA